MYGTMSVKRQQVWVEGPGERKITSNASPRGGGDLFLDAYYTLKLTSSKGGLDCCCVFKRLVDYVDVSVPHLVYRWQLRFKAERGLDGCRALQRPLKSLMSCG